MTKSFFAGLAAAGVLLTNIPAGLAATTVRANTQASASADLTNTVAERRFIRTFMRVGALNSTVYDNETIATATFDFDAYVNHPCFKISGTVEREECRIQFGTLGNLRSVLSNGTLVRLLATHELAFDAVKLGRLVASLQTDVLGESDEGSVDASGAVSVGSRADLTRKSERIWRECNRMETAGHAIRACYQEMTRHMRRS